MVNMKKNLIAVCLGLACFSAVAKDNVELRVDGTLVTAACTPSLNNGGVVNFGHIPLGNLSKTAVNRLGRKPITLTITCAQPTSIGFTTMDNRQDSLQNMTITDAWSDGRSSSATGNQYGLGFTAGNVRIGAYTVAVQPSNITVDGAKADGLRNMPSNDIYNTDWSKMPPAGATASGHPGYLRTISAAATGTLIPVAGKVFVYPLDVVAGIQATDTLAITDDTDMDGSATFSLVYL